MKKTIATILVLALAAWAWTRQSATELPQPEPRPAVKMEKRSISITPSVDGNSSTPDLDPKTRSSLGRTLRELSTLIDPNERRDAFRSSGFDTEEAFTGSMKLLQLPIPRDREGMSRRVLAERLFDYSARTDLAACDLMLNSLYGQWTSAQEGSGEQRNLSLDVYSIGRTCARPSLQRSIRAFLSVPRAPKIRAQLRLAQLKAKEEGVLQ